MTFYRRYESAVIGYLLRRTGNTELAVDLASDVFAEALASRGRYRRDGLGSSVVVHDRSSHPDRQPASWPRRRARLAPDRDR